MRTIRRGVAALVLAAVATGASGCSSDSKNDKDTGASKIASGGGSGTPSSSTSGDKGAATSSGKGTASRLPSNTTTMTKLRRETGGLTPKSVDASGTGLVAANNMIYTHTVTFYDAESKQKVATVPDTVDLKDYGLASTSTKLKGGPVEGVWTKDASHYYVSNYVMSGPGYQDEPNDLCTGKEKYKPSYVYRIDAKTKKIDQVIAAGAVPKYVALTHSEKHLLVSNWCSYSLGIIDTQTKKMVKQVPIAAWPRGIAVAPDDSYAYVAAFGTKNLYRVDLTTGKASVFAEVGGAARHVSMSPDGAFLYVVASHGNTVTKLERATGKKTGVTDGLVEPRSLTVSPDGKALYVVNYFASTVTKIDATTMKKIQVVHVGATPIGITYEPRTGQVWVANYGGSIDVFDDTKAAPKK